MNQIPSIHPCTRATPSTSFVSSEHLTTTDGTHFDTPSQLLSGERYAEEMIALQAKLPPAPKPPADIRFIDPHVHAMSVTLLGLRAAPSPSAFPAPRPPCWMALSL